MSTAHSSSLPECCIERAGGSLVRCKDVYIAQLQGSYAEMGHQHAALTTAACGDVVPQYMNHIIEKLVAHTLPTLARPIAYLLKSWFVLRNRAALGQDLQAHLHAMADGFGIKPAEMERLFFVPDIIHYLAGRSFSTLVPPPTCTGFCAFGPATQDGKLLIGRNFDFFGRGVWNANNAIIVMHPNNGQRLVWLGALGATGSGQGFNESGLVVSLHTKFTRDLRTHGTPLFKIVHDVLATCTTVDEAINRILAKSRICGLSLFIVDTKARTAAAVGFSARHAEIMRPEAGVLVRANHYLTEDMQRWEVAPYPWRMNSRARFQRVTECLAEKRGALTAQDIPAILSDCLDPYERKKRIVGSVVAAPNNVQSIVISPEDDALWVGHGDYPVCHSDVFRGFRMSALLNGDAEHYAIEDLPGGRTLTENERAALTEYEEAWSQHLDHLENDRSVFHLHRAAELLPDEPIFPRMAGILLLTQKKYVQALPLLQRNAKYPYQTPLLRAEALLWIGRCLDLMGRRPEAFAQYEAAAKLDAPPVSAAAAKHLGKPYKPIQLLQVTPEFIVGTAITKL